MKLTYKQTLVTLGIWMLSASVLASTVVNFYSWRRQDMAVWEQINKQNILPGISINVQVINRDAYLNFVLLELQNGSADLFLWKPGASNLKSLIERKLVEPFDGDLSTINSSALLASKGHDGQFYGVPFAIQLQSIMVNEKLVQKHGVTQAPQTMSELENIFSKLKSAGITPINLAGGTTWYVSQVLSEVLIAGLVDEQFSKQLISGEQCFTDSQYQQIFKTLKSWKDAGYLNDDVATGDYTVMSKAIDLGNAGMSIDGGWMASPTSDFYIIDPDYKFEFWVVPGKSAKAYALGDGSYQVGATSKQREAAERVLAFTTTKQFAELFAEHVNELPAYGGEMYIKPGELKTMADLVAAKTYGASLFTAYDLNKGRPAYNSLIIEAIQGVFTGKFTPEQAAQHIQTGLNSWGYIGSNTCG